ncbi:MULTISPECIES: ParB/Srx family N-terminal domain-containing protein [unclassified Yoonia]|uniref:ParB/Srx family N-terminal domain-containing protein n=1 Tax=unclassified Yoonia TaxID=2629118 RepID=UPI002AFEA967|nr:MULTISPECIES: ParB/Srx family N-terminal domain-containing protein [unclassified Yoonia]
MTKVKMPAGIEQVELAALLPYARNSRTHNETQVKKIMASMQEFGFTNPVLASDDGEIIAGHGRVLAAKKLGLTHVPVIRLSHLTEAQRRAYVIADNRLALDAGWDEELLELELGELQDHIDLSLTGFNDDELSRLVIDERSLDAAEDKPETVEKKPQMVTCPGCANRFDARKHGD